MQNNKQNNNSQDIKPDNALSNQDENNQPKADPLLLAESDIKDSSLVEDKKNEKVKKGKKR